MPASGVSFLRMSRAAALAAPLSGFAESLTRAIIPFPVPHRSIVQFCSTYQRPQTGKASSTNKVRRGAAQDPRRPGIDRLPDQVLPSAPTRTGRCSSPWSRLVATLVEVAAEHERADFAVGNATLKHPEPAVGMDIFHPA